MKPADRDLIIEALSMAANRKEQLAARLTPGNHHAEMAKRMRRLRLELIREREVQQLTGTVA